MTDYGEILRRHHPGREYSTSPPTDYDSIVFHDEGVVPTKAELDALWPQVEIDMGVDEAERMRYKNLMRSEKFGKDALTDILVDVLTRAIDEGKINSTPRYI